MGILLSLIGSAILSASENIKECYEKKNKLEQHETTKPLLEKESHTINSEPSNHAITAISLN